MVWITIVTALLITASCPPADRQLGVCLGASKIVQVPQEFRAGLCHDRWLRIQRVSCDGLDNDYDGQTDEALNPPLAIEQAAFVPVAFMCNAADGRRARLRADSDHEADEVTCDGLDNDCDGAIDEEIELPLQISPGRAGSRKVCRAAPITGGYPDIETYEIDEVTCDGLDNDCDGNVDEGIIPPLLTIKMALRGSQGLFGLDGIVEPATLNSLASAKMIRRRICSIPTAMVWSRTNKRLSAPPEMTTTVGSTATAGALHRACIRGI